MEDQFVYIDKEGRGMIAMPTSAGGAPSFGLLEGIRGPPGRSGRRFLKIPLNHTPIQSRMKGLS
jgi:hypothetical protein